LLFRHVALILPRCLLPPLRHAHDTLAFLEVDHEEAATSSAFGWPTYRQAPQLDVVCPERNDHRRAVYLPLDIQQRQQRHT